MISTPAVSKTSAKKVESVISEAKKKGGIHNKKLILSIQKGNSVVKRKYPKKAKKHSIAEVILGPDELKKL